MSQNHTFSINLSADRSRQFKATAPLVLHPDEVARIQGWVAVQFIVEPRPPKLTEGEKNFGDFIGA